MASGTIQRQVTGLFVHRSASTTVTNTITPTANGPQWFLLIASNQRASGHTQIATMNYYNGGVTIDMISGATSGWTASLADGVITITKGNTYLALTAISDLPFTLT